MTYSISKMAIALTAALASTPTPVAAAQTGVQKVGGRALQNPAQPPHGVVIPVAPANPIPINALPFTINQPGYYQVTKNLAGTAGEHGISVLIDEVIIDLNGFSITGNGGLDGIHCTFTKTTIFNGDIIDWAQNGISSPFECTVIDVRSVANTEAGMQLGIGSVVQDCKVQSNRDGIRGAGLKILDSEVFINQEQGIEATEPSLFVSGCRVEGNDGLGIRAVDADPNVLGKFPCVVEDCQILENEQGGAVLPSFAQVRRCFVGDNLLDGIGVGASSYVGYCSVFRNAKGIRAGAGSKIEGCTISANEIGILADDGVSIGDCEVTENDEGIIGSAALVVQRCNVSLNKAGIRADDKGARIENCTVNGNTIFGIVVQSNALVANNSIAENRDQGILVESGCRIEGNHLALNGVGIAALGTRNLIVRNSLDMNTVQLFIAPDNVQGPFLKAKGFIQSENPWANFDLSFPVTFP